MKLLLILCMFWNFSLLAEIVGISAHDVQVRSNYLSAELVNKISVDEGLGFLTRVTHFTAKRFLVDAGYAFHSGDREHRLFLGGALDIFSDYKLQPRVQLKAHTELVGDIDDFDFLAGITPIASKGISVGSNITYPFVALPIRRVFRKGAESEIGFNFGSTFEMSNNLILSAEVNLNLRNMPSSLMIGISTTL